MGLTSHLHSNRSFPHIHPFSCFHHQFLKTISIALAESEGFTKGDSEARFCHTGVHIQYENVGSFLANFPAWIDRNFKCLLIDASAPQAYWHFTSRLCSSWPRWAKLAISLRVSWHRPLWPLVASEIKESSRWYPCYSVSLRHLPLRCVIFVTRHLAWYQTVAEGGSRRWMFLLLASPHSLSHKPKSLFTSRSSAGDHIYPNWPSHFLH